MKKTLLLTLSLLVIAISVGMAKEVKKEDARKVAINAFYEKANQYNNGMSYADVVVTYETVREHNGIAAFYSFDIAGGGYIIISAEDAYTPVIGYSYTGEYPKGEQAYVYASFMQSFVDRIAYIRENNVQADETTLSEWNHLLTNEVSSLNIFKDPRDVEPLVSNIWNQDSPYNILCPEDAGGSGGYTYVGCVATAMSMIMHHYRYPIHGTGSHSYTPGDPSYGVQSADFENTYYQWNGMMDDIDSHNPYPIAELGYHCAVAVNMNFGPDGSGSYSFLVPNRLNAFLRFNNALYLEKINYSQSSWITILKGEIDISRPLYYSGSSSSGGHAFVCDGYEGDNFHFNFGWSGYGNGYYALNDVGGYYIGQGCVKNFYPSDPDYPYFASGLETITQISGQFTDGSGPIEDYEPNTDASWLLSPQTATDSITDVTLYFIDFELGAGDYLRIYDGSSTSDPMLGEYTGSTLPPQFTSTGNQLLVTLNTDGSGNGQGFKAEFYSDEASFCSGLVEITDAIGTFDDGSGDFNYGPGATCMFRIEPEYANEITLNFNYFDTEEDKDVLKIFDGTTLVGTFSGNTLPPQLVCTNGSVFITWASNAYLNYQGWEISYETDNVGIEENEAISHLNIFPNPAKDVLNIDFTLEQNQNVDIRLVDVTGEAVYTNKLTNVSGSIHKSIDVANFAKGIYILNVTGNDGSVNKKVIIK